jgi:hypothetical protein
MGISSSPYDRRLIVLSDTFNCYQNREDKYDHFCRVVICQALGRKSFGLSQRKTGLRGKDPSDLSRRSTEAQTAECKRVAFI